MPKINVVPFLNQVDLDDVSLSEEKFSRKRLSVGDDAITVEAVKELVTYFDTRKLSESNDMKRLLFYRLVKGGNIGSVSKVLDSILCNKSLHECALTGKKPEASNNSERHTQSVVVALNILVYVILAIIFGVITTVFYMFHSITCNRASGRGIAKKIHLPLMFAVMSSNVEMVKLFAERKRNILACVDISGFSIFHYLADLSTTNCTRSNRYFEILLEVFGIEEVRDVLMNVKARSNGLTGLEFAVSIGSPMYFTTVFETEGILKSTKLVITDKQILKSGMCNAELQNDAKVYKICEYDVTRYEKGDVLVDQGFLLTLLASRDLLEMADNEVDSLKNCSFLMDWMKAKIQHNSLLTWVSNYAGYLFSCVLCLYILMLTDDKSCSPLEVMFWSRYSELQQNHLTSVLNDSSSNYNTLEQIDPADKQYVINEMQSVCENINVSQNLHFENITKAISFSRNSNSLVALFSKVSFSFSIIILAYDVALRMIFLTHHYFVPGWDKSFQIPFQIKQVLSRPLQVSYISRHLTMMACFSLGDVVFFMSICSSPTTAVTASARYFIRTMMLTMIVFAGSCRFFSFLYSCRVQYSTGGIFIITICKMTRIVLQFASIYIMIAAFYATLFLLVVADPDCPAMRVAPFDYYFTSLLAVFSLTLGNNQLPAINTIQLAVLYIIYVILTNIVLLSLVTGISGSIADRVMSRRLKCILPALEELEDVLEVETFLLVCTYPFRKLIHGWRMKRSNDLYLVRCNKDLDLEVSIEIECYV